jgi:hypothetical protein
MDEDIRNIARNHSQIIDDWCEALLSQLYEEDVNDHNFYGKKYYFKRTMHEE